MSQRKSVPCCFCNRPCLARWVADGEPCHASCAVTQRRMVRKATAAERAAILAPVPAEEYWTTRDGRRIAVGDMAESHVRNALRMVLRNLRRARQHVQRKEELITWLCHAPDDSNFWDNDDSDMGLR